MILQPTPYAYGIKGYAVKEKLVVNPENATVAAITQVNSNYGIIPYTSFNSAKVLPTY